MKNKVEELLRPRYKVIAGWPKAKNVPVEVGDIFTNTNIVPTIFHCIGKGGSCMEDELKKYPHLFKKLEWWEDRKPEEMPEYVKTTNTVKKVYRFVGDKIYFTEQKFRSAKRYTPATESEYLSYLNSKP